MNLSGKTALVTGAARGIGKGCAIELARAGAQLVVNDRPDTDQLSRTVEELESFDSQVEAIPADVFSRSGCEQLVANTLARVAQIDILVSNPAYAKRCPFLEIDPDEFQRTVSGTLSAGFHLSQLVARHMVSRAAGGDSNGKIVFISSVQAEMSFAHSAAYNAGKAGLNQLARTIAVELSEHKINVNVVQPGWIDTPGERQTFGDDVIEQQGRTLPWQRLGTPEDIGKAVVFLASSAADYVSGSILSVDGGFRLKDYRASQSIQPI